MSEVVIIGAGPAGLTAAYELSKLGKKSIIIEADNQVGGLSKTLNYKGYRFDIGGHRFFTKIPYIQQIWEELLGDDLLLRSRLSRIYYRGKFFDYPLKALNALTGLGIIESILIGLSFIKGRLSPIKGEKTFEQWISNRFGYRLYRTFFKTYTEKVWGMSCKEISADWAAQRIKNLSLRQAVRNALLPNGNNNEVITTLIDHYYYPRLGPGMMWEHCQELLAGQGSPTFLNERVEYVSHQNGRIKYVSTRDKTGKKKDYISDQFVSSMPLKQLIQVLDPQPPVDVLIAANRLRYRDYLTVVLIVKRERVFPDNWIYVHAPEVMMGRIQNYKNWSTDMVPDPSKTSLGMEYFLWETDEQWNWKNEQLLELATNECTQLEIIDPDEVEDGTVVRMPKTYPVYDQNYQASLKTLRHYLDTFKNLQPIGRNGLHRYNNQDHSMLTGVYAARNIIGQTNNVWTVNTEQAYHEDGDAVDAIFDDSLTTTPIRSVDEKERDAIEIIFSRMDPIALGVAIGVIFGGGLFSATAILLLRGGKIIGPTLSLLGHYLFGFKVGWKGAFLGLFEAGIIGFIIGSLAVRLRNLGMSFYIAKVKRRIELSEQRKLLDKI